MARKKTKKPIEEVQKTQEEEVVTPESDKKKAFRALIERYKEQNLVKYAQKRERLEKKLNAMK